MIQYIREADLLERIRRIINDSPYDLRNYEGVGGTGGPGRLMEHLLGIDVNNVSAPDSVEYEIKTSMQTGSLVTLFHKEPGVSERGAISELVRSFGWSPTRGNYPAGTLSFRHTVGSQPSDRGFQVRVENNRVRVDFESNNVVISEHENWLADVQERCGSIWKNPPIWTHDELSRTGSRKLPNCIYLKGKKTGSTVTFNEATILRGFLPSEFFTGLREGFILIDFDARTNASGGIRNHGTKFRVRPQRFSSLYEKYSPAT